MKKFTSLLIGCSLALAGAALAQKPDDQASPKPNQPPAKTRGSAPAGPKADGPAAQPRGAAPEKQPGGPAAAERRAPKMDAAAPKMDKAADTAAKPVAPAGQPSKLTPKISKETHGKAAEATIATDADATKAAGDKGVSRPGAPGGPTHQSATPVPTQPTTPKPAASVKPLATSAPKVNLTPAPVATAGPKVNAAPAPSAIPTAKPAITPAPTAVGSAPPMPTASVAPSVAAAQSQEVAKKVAAAKKPAPAAVLEIKAKHANFRAEPRPDRVPTVTFTENRRIEGSDRWQGQQYDTFRNYRSERHDRNYYHSHYNRVELIGGGYYYFDNGYYRPAWGYNDTDQYYAYDGPIYVGQRAEPLDRVIADVQAALQTMGYYTGEVDGLLGPLTRAALTAYQQEQGLAETAAIDEPTLDALGLNS